MKNLVILLGLIIGFQCLHSQNLVKRNDTIKVFHGSDSLTFPFASGLNCSQTGNIDLNLDGLLDLVMFENNNDANYNTGDKMLLFINQGPGSNPKYKLDNKYRINFPILEDYAILKDWNCDGKVDIFTWDPRQRITAYKNVSDTSLKFKLETRIISTDTSDLPNNNPSYFHFGEILWAYFDMPSFEDIDGDGDIDILTTATNGHFIEYNKNMSMEKYGVCDSLSFKLKSTCWGQFFEDTGTVILDTCDLVNVKNPEASSLGGSKKDKSGRHSSDALLAIDLDGDGVKDLLAGDAGETGLYSFINGGKTDSSHMVSYTSDFPAVDKFDATIYGVPFRVDADFDGINDLVVSVGMDRLNDKNGIWFYKNKGSNSLPIFSLETKAFMQKEMIDVGTQSKPVFFDYNGDSLMDIVIGNLGYFTSLAFQWKNNVYQSQLTLYENIGTKQMPAFRRIDTNFANLDTLPLNLNQNKPSTGYHPTFGDLDGDGDEDMVLGDKRGKIHVFENRPNAGIADFHLLVAEFQKIDVGDFSTPQLFDLDEDGKLDLIIGETTGNLNYYRNTSSGTLSFVLEDDSLGDLNVRENFDWEGFSTPYFFKDSIGNTLLLCGTKSGHIRYYDSVMVGGVISKKFRRVEKSYQDLWDGIYSTIHGADIDDDGQPDFIMGNQSGGISLYTSEDSIYIPGIIEIAKKSTVERIVFPNPAKNEVTLQIKCNCQDEFEYSVYSVMGNLMTETIDDNKVTFDVSSFDSGLYFIRAQNKNRSIILTERFLKLD